MRQFLKCRRRLLLALPPIILLAAVSVWMIWIFWTGHITRAKFDAIEPGMSRRQIALLLSEHERIFLDQAYPDRVCVVGYSQDRSDRFPPRAYVWIQIEPMPRWFPIETFSGKAIAKLYVEPTFTDYWQRLVNSLHAVIGSPPPYEPPPFIWNNVKPGAISLVPEKPLLEKDSRKKTDA